jgi:SAM-dependent methyltransferase
MEVWLSFFILFILITLLSVAWSSVSLAPFVPARKKDVQRIFKLADLKQGEVFYDLGCGNGRVVILGAKRLPIKAVGVEVAWPMWLVCKLRGLFIKNAEFKFGNLFNQDLDEADAVYFFGMPNSVKKRLKGKLERELKPGAKVVSYAFGVPGWQPIKVDKPGPKEVTIYLYKR